jgi:hypothetical protein
MSKTQICDFCGRSIQVSDSQSPNQPRPIEVDADGLWVCHDCKSKILTKHISNEGENELDEHIQALIGKSAGAICRTLELPYEPPYQVIMDAASNIAYDQDRMMSGWLFVTQWLDNTTVWRDSDGSATAMVTQEGSVTITTP